MFTTRMSARLWVAALGAIAFRALVAGEPVGTPPPATSIREWRTTPGQTPAGTPAATPTLPARSIREWRATPPTASVPVAGEPVGTPLPARSIREWRTTPNVAPGPCPTATPIASLSATPAAQPSVNPGAGSALPTSPVTISIQSTMRQGSLVVLLDDRPVFNEKFQKPLLVISQTSTWDPLHVKAGTHRLTAKVIGTKKTYSSKSYDLHLSPKGANLRFVMQGDKLTVVLGS